MLNNRQFRWLPTASPAHLVPSFALALLVVAFFVPGHCPAQSVLGSPTIAAARAAWVPTGDLNVPRGGHTATLLHDGRVLVVGGERDPDNYAPATAELYDPATGTWSLTGQLSAARFSHTATLLSDGRVMVFGGCSRHPRDGCSPIAAEIYDPATGMWSFAGGPLEPTWNLLGAPLPNGKVLAVDGGTTGAGPAYGFGAKLFDPVAATWSSAGRRVFVPRYFLTATSLRNGQVLMVGGSEDFDFERGEPTAELYGPGAAVWRRTGDLNVGRIGHSASLLANGRVLVAGGHTAIPTTSLNGLTNYTRVAELYDAATGTWTRAGNLNAERTGHTATLLQTGEVLIAAGYDGSQVGSAEIYDPAGATFRTTASLSTARSGHTATLLTNGKVLVAGGYGSWPTSFRSAELYVPETPPATIGAGFTGTWFNPAQNGHGLTLEVLPGEPPQLLASWFTFAPQGGDAWIVGLGPIDGSRAVLQGYQSIGSGGRFPPNFNAANVRQEFWGTLTFTFSNCNHGRVEWVSSVPGYGSGDMDLTRLTLPAGLTCSDDNSGAGDWDY